jgi:all-trans-retinol 13,14-reductase
MKYDYVIIGAGVSGMTAALILAKNGFDVALVEKSNNTFTTRAAWVRMKY